MKLKNIRLKQRCHLTSGIGLLAWRMQLLLQQMLLEGSWKAEGSSYFFPQKNNIQKEKKKNKLWELIYQNFKEDNMFILVPLKLLTSFHTTFSKPVEASCRWNNYKRGKTEQKLLPEISYEYFMVLLERYFRYVSIAICFLSGIIK